jgi:hypothetical protein
VIADEPARVDPALAGRDLGPWFMLPWWISIPLAVLLAVALVWYFMRLGRPGVPRGRRWLRRASVVLALAVNVDDLRPGKPRLFLVSYVGLNAVIGVLLVLVPEFRRFGFAGVIASVLLSEFVLRRRTLRDWSSSLLIRAAAIQGVAFIIWNLDRAHIVCDPQFPLQGHAVWHALGAVASFQLWRYFTQASVRPARTAPP